MKFFRIEFTFLLFLLLSLFTTASGSDRFSRLNIGNGLAHTDANCLAQDSTGMMWIGTYAGLQSFDGYSLTHYNYYPSEQKVYGTHNRIRSMVSAGDRLWLGTESGLTCFDLNLLRYVDYKVEGGSGGILGQTILELCLDERSELMVVKTESGVSLLDVKGNIIKILPWNSDEERISAGRLWSFESGRHGIWGRSYKNLFHITERDGAAVLSEKYNCNELEIDGERIFGLCFVADSLYLRTDIGLHRFVKRDGRLCKNASLAFTGELGALRSSVNSLFTVSKDGDAWCGANEDILEIKAPFSANRMCLRYLNESNSSDMSALRISDFLVDIYNNVWIATQSKGVYYRSLSEPFLRTVSYEDFRRIGIHGSEVLAVCEHSDGTVYMIAEYRNLLRFHPKSGKMERLPLHYTGNVLLQSIAVSASGSVIVGSSDGVFVYNPSTQTTMRLITGNAVTDGMLRTSVSYMSFDAEGRLWISTWGRGLFCIVDPETAPALLLHIGKDTDPGLLSDRAGALIIKDNTVSVCTDKGLNRIHLNGDGTVRHISSYTADSTIAYSMSSNYLAGIDAENDSVFWLGTIGGGLNRLTIHSGRDNDYTSEVYTMNDGLPGNDCEIVMLDNNRRVWIGGTHISCLNTEDGHIDIYGGDESKAFKIYVFGKDRSGTMYMGGLYGLTYFNPEKIHLQSEAVCNMAFTGLYVNNVRIMPGVKYGGNVILDGSIQRAGHIRLDYTQSSFYLSFSALNSGMSPQLMYRYRLVGMDHDWKYLSRGENKAYFSNLPYGDYTLEVQYSPDNGSTWSITPLRLEIDMLPPWWWSVWMKLLYVVLFVGVATYVLHHYLREQKLKQENEIQKILIAQDDEKYQAKIRFFMNASHELKTPLTLIMLSAEKIVSHMNCSKECNMIIHQAKRMLTLISELADFRKTDLGISTLKPESVNISDTVRSIYSDVSVWAENKKINISYTHDDADIVMDADKEKICKMVINLLSNAIKYTGEGGSIEVSLHRGRPEDVSVRYPVSYTEGQLPPDADTCIITVSDTGVGISADSIRRIYERFFQVAETSRDHLGSGIGLAIVKNIVLQHNGVITVSSERGRGTEFIVALPVENCCSEDKDCGKTDFDFATFIKENYSELPEMEPVEDPVTVVAHKDAPVMLLVEDNVELGSALKEHFSATYNVHVAYNGLEGLQKCGELFPDIIVTDVMMPVMDGVEMCRRIKDNLSTAYIPLVMLTARGNVESQIEGYGSGADLYLSKPFSMKLLELNVRRLLKQKEMVMRHKEQPDTVASGEISEQPSALEPSYRNLEEMERQKLVCRLKEVIETNIQKTELSPDFIASELGLSRSALYSKVKRVDGMSLADYVRNRRLEKAAELLVTTVLTVQEVIIETGFTNASHFSKIFRMKYGMSPFEYRHDKDA